MSTKEIRWIGGDIINDLLVRNLEKIFKIKLPIQYVNIVFNNDGSSTEIKDEIGNWKEGIIDIPKWQSAGLRLISLQNAKSYSESMVMMTYKAFRECLPIPQKFFPFARDGVGNIYFFDYRKSENEPAIVFLDHERAITKEDLTEKDLEKKPLYEWLNNNLFYVCDSFSKLLDMIHPVNSY